MKTSSAKAKGRRLCAQVAQKILETFPTLLPDDVRITSSGAGGEDLQLSPQARMSFPFSVECKNTERLNLWDALRQCEGNAKGHIPLVVVSKNRSKTYAVVEFETFMQLLKDK